MNTDANRDQPIDSLLRRVLTERADAAASPACLDAETLAAWADGGLSESDLATAEAHAAECARCQAMLAALTKAAEAPAASRAWWRRSNLGWLVPLAAGATAILVWVAIPDRTAPTPVSRQVAESSPSDRLSADSKSVPSPDTPAAPPVQDRPRRAPAAAAPPAFPQPDVKSSAQEARAKDERDTQPATAALSEPAAAESRLDNVAAPQAAASAARTAGLRATQKEAAAAAPAEAVGGIQETASADVAVRWRARPAGVVQRSPDRGATWETLPTGVTADLVASSSPSASVCWVVGRGGTVLLTVDGRRFQRLPFPEAGDVVAVRATDRRSAIVTMADGRTFRTDNGGMAWTESR